MNRIRRINDLYQVLITPSNKLSSDTALWLGSWKYFNDWDDVSTQNYHILTFNNLRDAQNVAHNYPNIDWYRIVLNHEYIFKRLDDTIQKIIYDNNFTVEYYPMLMDPHTFKNTMFDRVLNGRFSMADNMNDLISFTIVNPWTPNLYKLAQQIINHKNHIYRDDLRIVKKKIVDGKIIYLYGITEFGTIYEIKLIPTLLFQWTSWFKKYGHLKKKYARKLYLQYLKKQDKLDTGNIIR